MELEGLRVPVLDKGMLAKARLSRRAGLLQCFIDLCYRPYSEDLYLNNLGGAWKAISMAKS